MDSNAVSIAITICIVGSSAAAYTYAMATNKKKNEDLQCELKNLLSDPKKYQDARNAYIQSKNGYYINIHR